MAEATNGRTIRHIEDAVTEELAIPQSVSAVRKRRGLANPIPDEQLQAQLADLVAKVHTIVGAYGGDQAVPMDETWRHPMADDPAVAVAIDYPLSVNQGRHDLEFITAIGRHLLARRPGGDDVFVIDPAPLYGLWLDIGDYGSDDIAIQDSLF